MTLKNNPKKRKTAKYKCVSCRDTFSALCDNVKRNGFYRCMECGKKSGAKKRLGNLKTHGDSMKSSPFHNLYNVYRSMVYRCKSDHPNYGGRGIKVCDEWVLSYAKFKKWVLSNGYAENLTIDRIDNDKGYYAENCRWTTMRVQIGNQRIRKENTSGYTGVRYVKRERRWLVTITVNYKEVYIGHFDFVIDGAIAREKYIIENDLPNRRNFTDSQMAEYLTDFQRYYADKGVNLTNPDEQGLLKR